MQPSPLPRTLAPQLPCSPAPPLPSSPAPLLLLIWIGAVVDVLIQAGFGPAELNEPVNVGSGCVVGLGDLALKIKEITNSPSALEICAARELEVDRFQADLHRAGKYFGLALNNQPLAHLSELAQN